MQEIKSRLIQGLPGSVEISEAAEQLESKGFSELSYIQAYELSLLWLIWGHLLRGEPCSRKDCEDCGQRLQVPFGWFVLLLLFGKRNAELPAFEPEGQLTVYG